MVCNATEAYMRIDHYGIYILRFFVIYTKPTGEEVSSNYLLGYGDALRVNYPTDSIKVRLIVQSEYFIGYYKTFFDTTYTIVGKRCFETGGASLTPTITEHFCPQYDNSYTEVTNAGGFVARFYVIYKTHDGKITTLDSGDLLLTDKRTLYYPPDVVSVRIKIDVAVFIGVYKTYYDTTFTTAERRCFRLTGTVFSVTINEFPCHVVDAPLTSTTSTPYNLNSLPCTSLLSPCNSILS